MEETSTASNRQRLIISGERKKKLVPPGRQHYKRNCRVRIANTCKDGYEWKSYGHKNIVNAKFQRYYFRCAHKYKGCGAMRHVQKLEDGSEMFHIRYIGSHTCQNMNKKARLFSDSKTPRERSPFGSDTENERHTEGGKRLQPDSSSKRRKLVKANIVVDISSESHESFELDHDAVQSSRGTDPCTGNVVLEKGPARRRFKNIVFSESGESSDHDIGPCTGNVVLEKGAARRRGEKIVFSESGESSNHETGPCTGNIVVEAPVSADKRRRVKQISFSESDESDLHVLDRVGYLPELVTSWYDRKVEREGRLRDRIARYRLRMTHQAAKNVKLAKKMRKLKKTTTLEKVQDLLAKNSIEHAKVVEALQTELENVRTQSEEKLKQAHEELQLEKERVEKLKQERVSLEKSLEQVSSERKWLIQEGFEYVINRLHRSQEYLGLLGAVQTNLWESGAHYGLVQCYESCKNGVALEDASLYNPEAYEKFLKAVHEMEHTQFPYIVALSQCAECSLDDLRALEPIGLEKDLDEVAVSGGDQ